MAVIGFCFTITWRDAKGQTRKTRICIDVDTGITGPPSSNDLLAGAVANIVTALQACSNAHVQAEANWATGGIAQSGVTYGATGEYQTVSQQARLFYLTVNPGGDPSPSSFITIPAPKSVIFESDLITINPTHADITALNTALNIGGSIASAPVAATASGLLLSTFVGGVLIGRRVTKRFTRYTKDPTLSIAGI